MRTIAFYLPQFHEVPENNAWWGEGFTEWTNVKKAAPLFKAHYQPHVPYHKDYYDLLDSGTMRRQIADAREYGLYGFCFYHYWFKGGKKLLEKPVENFLHDQTLDIHFCLCWANENWTRVWDGGASEVIMPQEYGEKKDWKIHFDYLLPFFKDARYIFDNEKPLLLIYRPELIPRLNEMLHYWNTLAIEAGLRGITYAAQGTTFCANEKSDDTLFDYKLMYEPGYTILSIRKDNLLKWPRIFLRSPRFTALLLSNALLKGANRALGKPLRRLDMQKLDYDALWEAALTHPVSDKLIPGAFTGWDNSARRGSRNPRIIVGSTPEKFKSYLIRQICRAKNEYKKDLLFITAWNEWGEGAHLEADEKYGYGYLQALKDALTQTGEFPCGKAGHDCGAG